MKKYIATIIAVVIFTIFTWLYGIICLNKTTGVHSPDQALTNNPNIDIMFTENTANQYFNNDCTYTYDDMENDSSFIGVVTVTDRREMSLYSTKTLVKIEKIYKDTTSDIKFGDSINIIEPASFINEHSFYTNGWQFMKTGSKYIVYLKNLECIDGYSYTKEEAISYMPVSEIYSKMNLTDTEEIKLYDINNTNYINNHSLAFISTDSQIIENYINIWNNSPYQASSH